MWPLLSQSMPHPMADNSGSLEDPALTLKSGMALDGVFRFVLFFVFGSPGGGFGGPGGGFLLNSLSSGFATTFTTTYKATTRTTKTTPRATKRKTKRKTKQSKMKNTV